MVIRNSSWKICEVLLLKAVAEESEPEITDKLMGDEKSAKFCISLRKCGCGRGFRGFPE
jgi:hypothetical protein